MFFCSTIRCSIVPPWLFHCSTISVPLFQHQMFYCRTIRYFTVPPSVFNCSIMIVPLFHHQMFCCSTLWWSTVPPSLFYCSTIRCSTVPPRMFYCSTIGCVTLPPCLFHCFTIMSGTSTFGTSGFVKPQRHFIVDYHFPYSPNVGYTRQNLTKQAQYSWLNEWMNEIFI